MKQLPSTLWLLIVALCIGASMVLYYGWQAVQAKGPLGPALLGLVYCVLLGLALWRITSATRH